MKRNVEIMNKDIKIPAVIWGDTSKKILIAVHGNLSNKEDTIISMLASKAVQEDYQVISFDLPEHGDRNSDSYTCTPQNCIRDLQSVYKFVKTQGSQISIFGCSLGAYFSLLAYHEYDVNQSIFLSPVVNMKKIINSLMRSFNISENQLKLEKQIALPIGQVLDWDYYTFVKNNPITFNWDVPTHILYGKNDTMCDEADIKEFTERYQLNLEIDEDGEHFYHTAEQLDVFNNWLSKVIRWD